MLSLLAKREFEIGKKIVKQLSSLARLRDNIYHRRPPAFNDFDRFVQRWPELIGFGDRTKTGYVSCPSARRQIRGGLFDANTDSLIFNGPLAPTGHALLMLFIVVIGSIVEYHDQQRNLILCCRPERIRRHQKVAVTDNAD